MPSNVSGKDLFRTYPVPVNELVSDRRERTWSFLKDNGLAAVVAVSTDSVGNRGWARFLANWPTVTQSSIVVAFSDGPTVLFVPHLSHMHWVAEFSWADEAHLSTSPARDVADVLRGKGCTTGRVGLVGGKALPDLAGGLREALSGVSVVEVDQEFLALRGRRSPIDLAFHRRIGEIADAAFAAIAPQLAPGVRENEIYGLAERTLRAEGCEAGMVLIGTGSKHNLPIPSARPLVRGDVVRLSVEPCGPGGYWGQVCRTFSLGTPSTELVEVYGVVQSALDHLIASLCPGALIGEVSARMFADLKAAKSVRADVVLGHGLGLDMSEPPRLLPDSKEVVREGMVLALHPGAYRQTFGVFIGETVIVTATGAVPITKSPCRLTVV